MLFIYILFLRYLHFCSSFFGCVGKGFDKKANLNFKIYDATNWNTNICNKRTARYFIK